MIEVMAAIVIILHFFAGDFLSILDQSARVLETKNRNHDSQFSYVGES